MSAPEASDTTTASGSGKNPKQQPAKQSRRDRRGQRSVIHKGKHGNEQKKPKNNPNKPNPTGKGSSSNAKKNQRAKHVNLLHTEVSTYNWDGKNFVLLLKGLYLALSALGVATSKSLEVLAYVVQSVTQDQDDPLFLQHKGAGVLVAWLLSIRNVLKGASSGIQVVFDKDAIRNAFREFAKARGSLNIPPVDMYVPAHRDTFLSFCREHSDLVLPRDWFVRVENHPAHYTSTVRTVNGIDYVQVFGRTKAAFMNIPFINEHKGDNPVGTHAIAFPEWCTFFATVVGKTLYLEHNHPIAIGTGATMSVVASYGREMYEYIRAYLEQAFEELPNDAVGALSATLGLKLKAEFKPGEPAINSDLVKFLDRMARVCLLVGLSKARHLHAVLPLGFLDTLRAANLHKNQVPLCLVEILGFACPTSRVVRDVTIATIPIFRRGSDAIIPDQGATVGKAVLAQYTELCQTLSVRERMQYQVIGQKPTLSAANLVAVMDYDTGSAVKKTVIMNLPGKRPPEVDKAFKHCVLPPTVDIGPPGLLHLIQSWAYKNCDTLPFDHLPSAAARGRRSTMAGELGKQFAKLADTESGSFASKAFGAAKWMLANVVAPAAVGFLNPGIESGDS